MAGINELKMEIEILIEEMMYCYISVKLFLIKKIIIITIIIYCYMGGLNLTYSKLQISKQ